MPLLSQKSIPVLRVCATLSLVSAVSLLMVFGCSLPRPPPQGTLCTHETSAPPRDVLGVHGLGDAVLRRRLLLHR